MAYNKTSNTYTKKYQFERSFLSELFMAMDSIKRDLKCSRTVILNPRFHMSLMEHPVRVIDCLFGNRIGYDDGFYHTILMISPKPPKITSEITRSAPPSLMPFHAIFLFVQLLHKTKRTYTYTEEAQEYFDNIFNQLQNWITMANEFDPFLR